MEKKSSAELCIEFCSITNSDFSLAERTLRKHEWNLEASLDEFFSTSDATPANIAVLSGSPPRKRPRAPCESAVPVIDLSPDAPSTSTAGISANGGVGGSTVGLTAMPLDLANGKERPDVFRIVSWNVDGLDDESLMARTCGVISEIQLKKPDVVFLQEIVDTNLAILQSQLGTAYLLRTGGSEGYFTATLLSRETMQLEDDNIVPFPNTRMGRNLLIVNALFDGIPLCLINSHLESTKDAAEERKHQLADAFVRMREAPVERTVIFGGDLNLRDSELRAIGGIPSRIVDLYTVTGSRKECENTWDTQRNVNAMQKVGRSVKKIICRFDRLYFRPSETRCALLPLHFNLVGLRKAPSSQKFPSDHWGILVTFDRIFPS
ncbi:tyrosyl-DNA phosphodiesterase 2-like [Paramacrobiotus metropolitanus]|uniref:tyrosyl-DNA phosphodiesterase 2-like n=1 Tax=Paramacrobiotus metropolitanus TaxID=2943436 RepID=UPI002446330A|nr:tyrosyl-DNA phosphodiesterase 2-like [Paramacrobiotus metropolitanus]